MKFILHLLVSAGAIAIASYIVPGVTLSGFWTAILVAVVLGLINIFIKPILFILTLPINIITLGLFSFILNAILIMIAASIVPGFEIAGFLTAILFAIVLSIVNLLFGLIGAK